MIFKKTYVLTLFLIVITVISCSKDKTDLPLPCLEDPSFDQIIKPIFQNNCVDCHNSNYAEGNVILEDYISIYENINSSMFRINAGTMPPSGPLEDSIINKIQCWIENGSQNN